METSKDVQRCLDAINHSLDERPISPDELPHFIHALQSPPSTIVADELPERTTLGSLLNRNGGLPRHLVAYHPPE